MAAEDPASPLSAGVPSSGGDIRIDRGDVLRAIVRPSSMKHRHQHTIACATPPPAAASIGNRTKRLRPSGPGSGRPRDEKSNSKILTGGERGRSCTLVPCIAIGPAVPGQRAHRSEDGAQKLSPLTPPPPPPLTVEGNNRLMRCSCELSQQQAQTFAE